MRVFRVLFFLFFLAVINDVNATTCKSKEPTDDEKTTFCFFSLNNPKEKKTFANQYQSNPNIEVKEFYGDTNAGKPVEDQFKEMLKTSECDSLVISGHHTGYFSGKQTTGNTLKLDFMEDISCEPGCAEWFSNVESLFLMGCQTVKSEKHLKAGPSADQESIRISEAYEVKANSAHSLHNQAFSSTLAENDKLSHRYLRMFPNSSLYGWGAIAPGEKSRSERSLPNFINLVSKLHTAGSDADDETADILNFLNFINNESNPACHQYLSARAWTKHWTNNASAPTACYIKDEQEADLLTKQNLQKYQKLGCDLKRALETDNQQAITQAINKILQEGPSAIEANFNRLMSLITDKDNKDKSWYNSVINQLKANGDLKEVLISSIKDSKTGFTRKADYLYFYQEMGWNKDTSDEDISTPFLEQLSRLFQESTQKTGANSIITKSLHLSLLDSIADNNLQSLLSQKSPQTFNNFVNAYETYPANPDPNTSALEWIINYKLKQMRVRQ